MKRNEMKIMTLFSGRENTQKPKSDARIAKNLWKCMQNYV